VLHVEYALLGCIKYGRVNERRDRVDALISERETRSVIRWLGRLWCREHVTEIHVRVKGEICALEIHYCYFLYYSRSIQKGVDRRRLGVVVVGGSLAITSEGELTSEK
jgi:hypothetical protein